MAKKNYQRTIYMDDTWWRRVKAAAKRRGVAISELVRQALAAFLGHDDEGDS